MQWMSLESLGFSNYSVSSLGEVHNERTRRPIRPSRALNGAWKVSLVDDAGVRRTCLVSRLVALAFVDGDSNILNTPIHLNGDKTDCSVENLVWRPRWFSYRYHAQFKTTPEAPVPDFAILRRVVDVDTGVVYENTIEAAQKHGLLLNEIFLSLLNGSECYPTWQVFDLLDKPE